MTPPRDLTTHVYKQVGRLPIRADVYGGLTGSRRPVIVWIHGGALIMGGREEVPEWLLEGCTSNGSTLVSIDYRLTPETKLPEVVQDVTDAVQWIRTEGPELFGADPERVAVVGESAGGYLTLTTGYRVFPPPLAVVSLWGYGDLVGPWYTQPSAHPCHHEVEMTRAEAFAQVSGPPISNESERKGNGYAFYQFCRQQGLWPAAVSGWDPATDRARFEELMPIVNVSDRFPPTLLIHGESDTDVPCEQSQLMADELSKSGVEHRLLTVAGAEHGLVDAEPAAAEHAFRETVNFLNHRGHTAEPART